MNWSWVFVGLYIALIFLGAGYAMAKHGQPTGTRYNWWAKLTIDLVWLAIMYGFGAFDRVLQ